MRSFTPGGQALGSARRAERPGTAPVIPADTTLGSVRLTVADLGRSLEFYERVLGMRPVERDDGLLALGPADGGPNGRPLLILHADATAPPINPRLTGLFHLAVLVPSRRDLAVSLLRIAQSKWPLQGASEHLVSEALYLADPDGNGIEIYRDRPRDDWRRDAGGQLQMTTLPLDLDDVISELHDDPPQPGADDVLAPGTRIGHVHLQVSELEKIEAFYHGVLGFDVMVRGFPGALFVSAGGYHHHLGLNTWNSAHAGAPAPNAAGLHSYEIVLPSETALQDALDRLTDAGHPVEQGAEGALVRDPSGNGVLLVA